MHDRALTGINLILQNKDINKIYIFKNLILSLNSFMNFKRFIISLIVKIISILPLRKYLIKIILKSNPYYNFDVK